MKPQLQVVDQQAHMLDQYWETATLHLKEARAKGKLAEFIRQREKTHPHTRKYRFRVVVKLMALNKPRAKRKG